MVAHTLYGYDLELCLGIGRQDEAGSWDVDRWNDVVWDQPDTALGDFVDVTCSVPGTAQFGANSDESRGVTVVWEAATCDFELLGAEFDPWNGPHASVLGAQTPVRWRWRLTGDTDWNPLFLGAVIDGGYQWDPRTLTAKVACSDSTSDLSSFDIAAADPPVGAGETAAARVVRILDAAQWPADKRDVDAGGVQLVSTDLAGSALDQLQAVAETDLALLWVRRDGALAYRPQGRANPVLDEGRLVVCLSGDPGEVQVVDLRRSDASALTNIASVRGQFEPVPPDDAVEATYSTVEDSRSIARYRARKDTFDLLHDEALKPSWSHTVAQLVVAGQAWPSTAPYEAVLGLASGDPRVPAVLFSLEPDTAFIVVDPAGREWRQMVVGWDVMVSFDSCGGTLFLNDLTSITGGQWDSGIWDQDRFGLGQVG